MHSADLGHTSKSFELAKKWSLRVSEEFTLQVEEEKALGLPVTSYLEGLTDLRTIAKQEIKFISVIIQPLFI